MIAKLLTVFICFSMSGPYAQHPPEKSRATKQTPRVKRSLKSAGAKGEINGRRGRNGRLLPSEREEMQLERWVRLAVRTYGLDEQQEAMVRDEVDKIRQERRDAMGEEGEEYEQLKLQLDAMYEAALTPKPGEEDLPASERAALQRERRREIRSNPTYVELQQRKREIEQKHAFDMETYIHRIEQLLPEDQVRRAADKRRIMDERREQRREEHERRIAQRRAEHTAQQQRKNEPAKPAISSVQENRPKARSNERASNVESGGQKSEAGNVGQQEAKQPAQAAAKQAQQDAERQRQAAAAEADRLAEAAAANREKNMHPWEKHVRGFIAQYEMTPRQANAAMSILQDSLKREQQYLSAYSGRIEAAKKITDKAKQDAELAKLEQPRQYIFKELTKRLDSLLTARQRAKGKAAAQETKR